MEKRKVKFLGQKAWHFSGGYNRGKAVSYTHLDVYKRQV